MILNLVVVKYDVIDYFEEGARPCAPTNIPKFSGTKRDGLRLSPTEVRLGGGWAAYVAGAGADELGGVVLFDGMAEPANGAAQGKKGKCRAIGQ